jgi:hypothetical protein
MHNTSTLISVQLSFTSVCGQIQPLDVAREGAFRQGDLKAVQLPGSTHTNSRSHMFEEHQQLP